MKKFFLAFCAALAACDSGSGSSQDPSNAFIQNDAKHEGMILLNANRKSVTLGSKLTVEFTYNFSMDQHEVTCQADQKSEMRTKRTPDYERHFF